MRFVALRSSTPSLASHLARPRHSLHRFVAPIACRAKPPDIQNDKAPAWRRLILLLLTPGPGQVRIGLDDSSQRTWTEVMMLPSHAAFVPGIVIAAAQTPPLPELAVLQASTLTLSLAYHRNYERAGALAQAEGVTAKLLFLYGTAQTLSNCPAGQHGLFAAEACCFGLTLGCFIGTNFDKRLVCPGLDPRALLLNNHHHAPSCCLPVAHPKVRSMCPTVRELASVGAACHSRRVVVARCTRAHIAAATDCSRCAGALTTMEGRMLHNWRCKHLTICCPPAQLISCGSRQSGDRFISNTADSVRAVRI